MATETESLVEDQGLVADIRRLLELRRQADEISRQAKPINAEIGAIEARVIEQMGLEGMESMGIDGYTVTRTKTSYASVADGRKEELIKALQQMGLGEKLVTINHPAFKSRVAEWIAEDAIPSGLADMIKVFDKHGLSVRKK